MSVREREHSAWLLVFSLGPTVVGGSILKDKEIRKAALGRGWMARGGSQMLVGGRGIDVRQAAGSVSMEPRRGVWMGTVI